MGDLSNLYTNRLKDDTVITSILEVYHLLEAEEKLLESVYPWERNALGQRLSLFEKPILEVILVIHSTVYLDLLSHYLYFYTIYQSKDSECRVRVKPRIFPWCAIRIRALRKTARQISNFGVVNEVNDGEIDFEKMDVTWAVGEWL